jgi:dCMP deaminase
MIVHPRRVFKFSHGAIDAAQPDGYGRPATNDEVQMDRPSWDEYFMAFTFLASKRSTCLRRQVGAVIVKERNILATGYNGPPKGVRHPEEVGCLRDRMSVPSGERHELCRGLHAEQNAIIQAAYHGVSIRGGTIYCTNQPCGICAKMIINAGIVRIVYVHAYDDPIAREMLSECEITVEQIPAPGAWTSRLST